jgi:putative membrane protein
MIHRIALIATTALLATAASVAQPQTVPNPSSTASSSSTRSGATLKGQDATFLRKAAESGQMEVDQAQQALSAARNEETRNAASMILADHRSSNEKLAALAQRKGWSMPASAEHDTSAQARSSASGYDFDKHYVRDQIAAHEKSIALFRAQVAGGSDPDLVAFARESLPTLEKHLSMLQAAQGGGGTSKQ